MGTTLSYLIKFKICSVPVIIGSGAGSLRDIEKIIEIIKPEAICLSSLIYDDFSIINKIKKLLENIMINKIGILKLENLEIYQVLKTLLNIVELRLNLLKKGMILKM